MVKDGALPHQTMSSFSRAMLSMASTTEAAQQLSASSASSSSSSASLYPPCRKG